MDILKRFGLACMFRQQTYLLPLTLYWYQANGLSAADFVSIQGLFILLGLFVEVPSGYIADMFSKKFVLLFSFTLFLLRSVLWLNFNGLWVILLGEMLVLLSRSFFQGVYDSYVYEYLNTQGKTAQIVKYCGMVTSFINIGTGTASLLCSALYPRFSLYVLLWLEFTATVIAIVLMSFVPNIKVPQKHKDLKKRCQEVIRTVTTTLSDGRVNHYIVLSAVFASSTYVFIWSFQPIMKATGVAACMFGVVYFFNFLFRALASYFAKDIIGKLGYGKLALLVSFHIFFSLSGMVLSFWLKMPILTLLFIFFICLGIGLQLAFNIMTTAKIQKIAADEVRATKSSTNNMVSQGVSGIILSSFKFITNESDFLWGYISVFIVYTLILSVFYLWRRHKNVNA